MELYLTSVLKQSKQVFFSISNDRIELANNVLELAVAETCQFQVALASCGRSVCSGELPLAIPANMAASVQAKSLVRRLGYREAPPLQTE